MAPVDFKDEETFRVFMTGFGPFRGLPDNPSWLAVKQLHNTTIPVSPSLKAMHKIKQIHISAFEMPVVYDSVLEIVPGLHQVPPVLPKELRDDPILPPPPQRGYDFILHVGLGLPQPIRLERLGHKDGYQQKDVEGKQGPLRDDGMRGFGAGYEEFGREIKTSIDVDSVVSDLGREVNMVLSSDPGRYLCDFIYYCSLAEAEKSRLLLKRSGPARPVLFIHCSPVGNPTSTEDLVAGITRIVEWVQSGLGKVINVERR